jgi:putative chitinase
MLSITAADLTALTKAAANDNSIHGAQPLGSVIGVDRAGIYAPALDAARAIAALDTPLRVRHFIAQVAHETASFGSLVESTRYTNAARLEQMFKNVTSLAQAQQLVADGAVAIGNCIYANRLGNGDAASGDGYRYRGRGFLMITGKTNYADVESYSGLPVLSQPELLGQPTTAAEAAARFWAKRNINALADADDCDAVTRVVNGGMNGAERRREWLKLAQAVWP